MTVSVQISGGAGYALYTYYDYVRAWVIYVERTYGCSNKAISNFVNKMQSLSSFGHLQGGTSCSNEIVASYSRGQLTLSAMRKLPIENHPEITISANLWLPVQSYYAIHGVGLASLIALGQQPPKDHRAFRASFSQIAGKYFPVPFCACCNGGPQLEDFSFSGICTSPAKVAAQSNLANPIYSAGDHYIGKSLQSTRKRILDELFDKERHSKVRATKKRRNLSKASKQTICQGVHGISICDFIYRMRVRSNYDDPDMYLFASKNVEDAVSHYENLRYLTEIIVAGLSALIERKIGRQEMARLKARLEQ